MAQTRAAFQISLLACLLALVAPLARGHEDFSHQIEFLGLRIKRHPEDATLYMRRGELHDAAGDLALALADFQACRRLDPKRIDTHFLEGRAYLRAGRFNEAAAALELFLTLKPDDPGATLHLARAKAGLGARAEAERLYDRSLAALPAPKPDDYIEHCDYIRADAERDRAANALAIIDKAVARLGPIVTLQLKGVELDLELARPESALARLDTLIAQSGRKDQWLVRKGEILADMKQWAPAREALERARAEINDLPPARRRATAVAERERKIKDLLSRLPDNDIVATEGE